VNVDAAALGDVGEEMLKDFVEHGGTVLYAGDLWAFDRGHVKGNALETLLPVLRPTGNTALTLRRGDCTIYYCDANAACGEALAADAVMLYADGAFTLKPGARKLLAGKDGTPVLVAWTRGQGRVIAVTGTALGEAPAGKTLFTLTPSWSNYLASLLKTP
jgi:hypothetical protein